MRSLEGHRLQGRGGEAPGLRQVLGQDHLAAALPNSQLVAHRARGALVGTGDDVKDDLRWCGNLADHRSQGPNAATETEIKGQGAPDEEAVANSCSGDRGWEKKSVAHGPQIRPPGENVSRWQQKHGAARPGIAADLAAQRYSPRRLTEGERWTAQELSKLRSRRYRPRAWAAFIAEASRRSSVSRSRRPQMARQAQVWGVAGATLWTIVCGASRTENPRFPFLRGLAWWFGVWRMLDWHLGMAEGGDGHPRERLSPADAITLARFWLVPW